MAKRRKTRKRVGAVDTGTILLVGGGIAVVFLLMNANKPATTVVKPVAAPSSAATTAAEITAGATAITSILNSITSDDNS
jgi:hypothetical protein